MLQASCRWSVDAAVTAYHVQGPSANPATRGNFILTPSPATFATATASSAHGDGLQQAAAESVQGQASGDTCAAEDGDCCETCSPAACSLSTAEPTAAGQGPTKAQGGKSMWDSQWVDHGLRMGVLLGLIGLSAAGVAVLWGRLSAPASEPKTAAKLSS